MVHGFGPCIQGSAVDVGPAATGPSLPLRGSMFRGMNARARGTGPGTQACEHAREHTYMHVCTDVHVCTDARARTHACRHTDMHVCTDSHPPTHSLTHRRVCARTRVCTHARPHALARACTHTQAHATVCAYSGAEVPGSQKSVRGYKRPVHAVRITAICIAQSMGASKPGGGYMHGGQAGRTVLSGLREVPVG